MNLNHFRYLFMRLFKQKIRKKGKGKKTQAKSFFFHNATSDDAEASNFKLANEDDFWLGINDLATQFLYVYASDGQEVVDGMWSSGQPNSATSRCAGYYNLATQYDSNAGWYDRPCSDSKFSICQVLGYEGKEGKLVH